MTATQEYLTSRFDGTESYCLLTRVPIVDAATLTPDWTLSRLQALRVVSVLGCPETRQSSITARTGSCYGHRPSTTRCPERRRRHHRPTIRAPDSLLNAMRLAAELDCVLVTLHSKHNKSATEAALMLPKDIDIDLLAIDIASSASYRMPHWETSQLLASTAVLRPTDRASKRNIGIMLSRMANWSCVLFLDDDIGFPAGKGEVGGPAAEQDLNSEDGAVQAAAKKVKEAVRPARNAQRGRAAGGWLPRPLSGLPCLPEFGRGSEGLCRCRGHVARHRAQQLVLPGHLQR